jgi:hypothetical protein
MLKVVDMGQIIVVMACIGQGQGQGWIKGR